jgi:hypothetical protein
VARAVGRGTYTAFRAEQETSSSYEHDILMPCSAAKAAALSVLREATATISTFVKDCAALQMTAPIVAVERMPMRSESAMRRNVDQRFLVDQCGLRRSDVNQTRFSNVPDQTL